jgi:hypothetical protein
VIKSKKMKTILTGIEAIEAYEEIQASRSIKWAPRKCGYFTSDDYEGTEHYDSGTIVAFDNSNGDCYEETFERADSAIDWINL